MHIGREKLPTPFFARRITMAEKNNQMVVEDIEVQFSYQA